MSVDLYLGLKWLPDPPNDFRTICRSLSPADPEAGACLEHLATYALNEPQLRLLARTAGACAESRNASSSLTRFKLAIAGDAALNFLPEPLIATAIRHGICLNVEAAGYGSIMGEAMLPNSRTNSCKPDAIFACLDYRSLPHLLEPDGVNTALQHIKGILGAFRRNAGCPIIVPTFPPPPETRFGNVDRLMKSTLKSRLADLNAALCDHVARSGDILLDLDGLASTVGTAHWYSPEAWYLGRVPFSPDVLPLFADVLCRVLGAMKGKRRKCLVLDLDNTLWGGVVGDDGYEALRLGQGDPEGEAYQDLQRVVLDLHNRGIILAVSSKNDDKIAREPFAKHPEMLLREEHITVFQANWDDKVSNIKSIADHLGIGLDALVFLDDNIAERNLVRKHLPQVAVPEVGSDAAMFARTLLAAGYFEAIAVTDEDAKRNSFYKENAKRLELKSKLDLGDYLTSLNMRASFSCFDAVGRDRIVQLINRSNQFNLTGRRYSSAEIEAFESDCNVFSLQVRLLDIFGDNGMVSTVICKAGLPGVWKIDSWIMSCRVLGRGLEQAVIAELVDQARQRSVQFLEGEFLPTGRNELVRHHFRDLGFTPVAATEGDSEYWNMKVSDFRGSSMPIQRIFKPN